MLRNELDSQADTIFAGGNYTVVHYIDRVCDVSQYYNGYEFVKGVPVIHTVTGYTNNNGDNFILILNKALYMPNLIHILINPNQLCQNYVKVQDNPYTKDPMVIQSHSGNLTAYIQSGTERT